MAETQTRARSDREPAEVQNTRPSSDVGVDDHELREKQRQRNNKLVRTAPFSGDTDDLLAGGVPRQLVEGKDPDAKLID